MGVIVAASYIPCGFMGDIFLGVANGSTVQPVVAIERGPFYRSAALSLGRCEQRSMHAVHLTQ